MVGLRSKTLSINNPESVQRFKRLRIGGDPTWACASDAGVCRVHVTLNRRRATILARDLCRAQHQRLRADVNGVGVGFCCEQRIDRGIRSLAKIVAGQPVIRPPAFDGGHCRTAQSILGNQKDVTDFGRAPEEIPPVKPGVERSALVKSWGEFTADATPLADIAKARAAALKIMETVDFDG